jgi:hypothetical protein
MDRFLASVGGTRQDSDVWARNESAHTLAVRLAPRFQAMRRSTLERRVSDVLRELRTKN